MTIDEAKQLDYVYKRRDWTAAILIETNPPVVVVEEPPVTMEKSGSVNLTEHKMKITKCHKFTIAVMDINADIPDIKEEIHKVPLKFLDRFTIAGQYEKQSLWDKLRKKPLRLKMFINHDSED